MFDQQQMLNINSNHLQKNEKSLRCKGKPGYNHNANRVMHAFVLILGVQGHRPIDEVGQ
jgi:hypothetical protein